MYTQYGLYVNTDDTKWMDGWVGEWMDILRWTDCTSPIYVHSCMNPEKREDSHTLNIIYVCVIHIIIGWIGTALEKYCSHIYELFNL